MKDRWTKAARFSVTALVAAVAIMFSGAIALAQNVIVQGNHRIDSETIRSYVTGQGSGSLSDARRQLLATGLFSDVRITRGRGGAVLVSVKENNVVNRVVFEGAKKVRKNVLKDDIVTKAGGPFTEEQLQADQQRILEVYKRGGRGLATVTHRIVPLQDGRVDVVFTIKEGDKTGVREIKFVGNQVYSASRLRNVMTTTEMNFLSWIKTSDVYDPDRIASDEELIRRFYLKHGYADFRIVNTDATFDAGRKGWIVTITVDEGQQYHVGSVKVVSRIADVPEASLRKDVVTSVGDVYDAEDVDKTLQAITISVERKGYAFAQVRPSGVRDTANHTIALSYIVEEGPRVYIERINVSGNTRTRDYVIRRELDLAEGDAYNKVLIDRAEKRLNALGFFKKVRITNEPGSTPDRVILNVNVEDQPTGQFSISGGYSTADGVIGDVSVQESNFLGRGQFVKLSGQLGQRTHGVEFSFTEPYFLGHRLAAGFDLFNKFNDNTKYSRYESRTTGGQLRLGLPVTDNFTVQLRYSLYQTKIKVPDTYSRPYNDCSYPLPGYTALNTDGTATYPNCAYDGEASVAIKEAQGRTLTSLAGVTLTYNTLDDYKNPHSGIYAELKPEVAGIGGDSKFVRVSGDARYYHEIYDDVVGLLRVQAGHISAFGGKDLRLVDNYFLGPTLVRGFEPSGIGPRDLNADPNSNALGGTTYFGGTAEVQFPIPGVPREIGLRGAVFADAGTLFGYKGSRTFDLNGNGVADCSRKDVQPECVNVIDKHTIRSSVGASLLWQSPLGPIRFDYAYALTKATGDRTQAFRFSGGTRF